MIDKRNVVVFDNVGIPSFMVKFSKCTNADLFPGGTVQTHPAFIIDGEEVDEIFIMKYPATMINGKPYSLPFSKPATNITQDKAVAACLSKGMLTMAESALMILDSKRNNTLPHGNTNYGEDYNYPYEKGECFEGHKTLTGSGPVTWSHDHTPYGVYDLCGNVWEMIAGFRLMNGEIQVIQNNNAAKPIDTSELSPLWKPVLFHGKPARFVINNGEIRLTSEGKLEGWDHCIWDDLQADRDTPELLKALGLCPADNKGGTALLYIDTEGERLPIRGGNWDNGPGAGVFALDLFSTRSYTSVYTGFRAAFYHTTKITKER